MSKELVIVHNSQYQNFDVKDIGGVYPRHSVLAGQPMIVFIDSFETLDAAQAAYPQATVSNDLLMPQNTFDHLPDDADY
jgi:hypothetical protein